jgi:hypothetical protein
MRGSEAQREELRNIEVLGIFPFHSSLFFVSESSLLEPRRSEGPRASGPLDGSGHSKPRDCPLIQVIAPWNASLSETTRLLLNPPSDQAILPPGNLFEKTTLFLSSSVMAPVTTLNVSSEDVSGGAEIRLVVK